MNYVTFSIVGLNSCKYAGKVTLDLLRSLVGMCVVIRRSVDPGYPDALEVRHAGAKIGNVRKKDLEDCVQSVFVNSGKPMLKAVVVGVDEKYLTLKARFETEFVPVSVEKSALERAFAEFRYSGPILVMSKELDDVHACMEELLMAMECCTEVDKYMRECMDQLCGLVQYGFTKEMAAWRSELHEWMERKKDLVGMDDLCMQFVRSMFFRKEEDECVKAVEYLLEEIADSESCAKACEEMQQSAHRNFKDIEMELEAFPLGAMNAFRRGMDDFTAVLWSKDIPYEAARKLLSGIGLLMRMKRVEQDDVHTEEDSVLFDSLVYEAKHCGDRSLARTYDLYVRRSMRDRITPEQTAKLNTIDSHFSDERDEDRELKKDTLGAMKEVAQKKTIGSLVMEQKNFAQGAVETDENGNAQLMGERLDNVLRICDNG